MKGIEYRIMNRHKLAISHTPAGIRLLLTIGLGAAVFLFLAAGPATAINGGVPDGDAHPNVGLMGVFYQGAPVGACTATLIGVDTVLTAAHCIENALSFGEGVTVLVSFDEDPVTDPGSADWKTVSQLIMHPDYYWGPWSDPHDLGLLILDEEVLNIAPATLPTEGFLNDLKAAGELQGGPGRASFTVVGYGAILLWPPPTIELVPHPRRQAWSRYRSLQPAWLNLSQNPATGDGGSCFGDSGGPVFWTGEGGDEILVGVTSWGDPNCISPSFNYRTDTARSLDFIGPFLGGLGL